MNKTGMVYRYVAERLLEDRKAKFVERGIAKELHISPDTVSNAIKPLSSIGCATVSRRYFYITNFKKLLTFWAVHRKLGRDTVYRTYVAIKDVGEIEDHMPDEIAYTMCSGYVKNFGNDAADYSEVHVYAGQAALEEIKRRFPKKEFSKVSDYTNLVVMKPDGELARRIDSHSLSHSSVSLPQLYVDLWNSNTWYAYEFLKKLEKRIDDIYAKAVLE